MEQKVFFMYRGMLFTSKEDLKKYIEQTSK
jgi:hypothetical protein